MSNRDPEYDIKNLTTKKFALFYDFVAFGETRI